MKTAPANWIIAAKLAPPRPTVSLIERQELLEKLDQALECPLTLMESPAGYGKTTLLGQWTERLKARGVTVGWLTLEEDDGDPLQFLSYVVSALASAGAALGAIEHGAEQCFVDVRPKAALAALVQALSKLAGPVVLILDDYHRLQSPEADRLIDQLLHHQPAGFHLVINTRERPRLPIAGLRAEGRLLEISVDQMRFSVAEGERIFEGRLSPEEISLLVERTEGWAVALQLARLWLEEKRDRATLIEKFSGRISEIADYLAEQVLADLPADLRMFLLQTSILEGFDGSLANAVCGREDSFAVLDRLDRLNCLLVPLDSERRWFRYHHLFAEFLSDLLLRSQGPLVPALHLAASQWFAGQGLLREAVRHAHLAGDPAAAARLIEKAGGWEMVLYGGIGTLRNLLRHFPENELLNFPRVALGRSYLHMKDGEIIAARAIIEKLMAGSAVLSRGALPPGDLLARDAFMLNTLLMEYEDKNLSKEALDQLLASRKNLAPDDDVGFGCLYHAACLIALAIGEMAKAVECATLSMKCMRRAGSILGLNYCYFHLGQGYFHQGMIAEAEAAFRQSLDMAEDNFGADSGLKAVSEVLLASLLYIKGDLDIKENPDDQALAQASCGDGEASSRFFAALTHVEQYDGWVDIYAAAYSTGAGLECQRKGLAPALDILARGEQTAALRDLPRLGDLMRVMKFRLQVRAGDLAAARRMALEIEADFTPGAWRQHPELWRRHHIAGAGLAGYYLKYRRISDALAVLDDLEEAARAVGLKLCLIEVLALRSLVLAESGRLDAAALCLDEAFGYARSEAIRRVFLDEGRQMEKLLRQILRRDREIYLASTTRNFIADLLRRFANPQGGGLLAQGHELFSPRELEVLAELGQGGSNKQIARSLDMTENTVKFHLKNIFVKLAVDKRSHAISAARRLNLLA